MSMEKAKRGKIDFIVLITVLILTLFGCVMVYSASYYGAALDHGGDGAYYFRKQLLGAVLGLASLFFFMRFDFKRLESMKWIILGGSTVLLLMVFLPPPIGVSINGSSRWVNIGITTLQPAEVAKFGLIIYLASYFAQNRNKLQSFWHGVMPALLVVGAVVALIYLQPTFP